MKGTTSTLRMRGPSKEGRKDPIVSIALVVDRNGIPIDFYIYRGNASEKVTMDDSIKALEKKYHITNTIVVADGGLNTRANIGKLADRKHGFLLSRSVPKMGSKLIDKILVDEGWEVSDNGNLKLKEIEIEEDCDGKKVKARLIVGWSHQHYLEDQYRIQAHKKAAEQAILDKKSMKSTNWGWKKYVVCDASVASSLNNTRIKKDEKIAGYFAYEFKDGREYDEEWVKNPIGRLTPKEVMEQYKCLVRIEECFRIMKHDFELRPLFVYTDVHIIAQVLICVLALILIRVLANKLKNAGHPMTIDEIIFALVNARVAVLMNPGSPVLFAPLCMERIKVSSNDKKTAKFKPYRHTNLSRIMEVVGLKALPAFCGKDELGKCLGTRFYKDMDAVGYLDPEALDNANTKTEPQVS